MLIQIPGRGEISFKHLVLDYNGTIAIDGQLLWSLSPYIQELANSGLVVHVLTADTFGTVREQCSGLDVVVEVVSATNGSEAKRAFVEGLDGGVCCFGNGYNDRLMFEAADFSIAILEREGMSPTLLSCADMVVSHAADAFDVLLAPQRLVATLRG